MGRLQLTIPLYNYDLRFTVNFSFVISPGNPFLSNLYLGHDRMTMDKRGSP